jgi:hypothetical protein
MLRWILNREYNEHGCSPAVKMYSTLERIFIFTLYFFTDCDLWNNWPINRQERCHETALEKGACDNQINICLFSRYSKWFEAPF